PRSVRNGSLGAHPPAEANAPNAATASPVVDASVRPAKAPAQARVKESTRPNSRTRKPPAAKPVREKASAELPAGAPEPAGFVQPEIQQFDAPMWPVQPVIWFERDWETGMCVSSGLRIERHHKLPVPGFVGLDPARGYRLDDGKRELPRSLP